jgi:hypothetical protein
MKRTTKKIIFVEKKINKEKSNSWSHVLITINIWIFKLLCFFNQLIIVINQKLFNFQIIFHGVIWHTISMQIIKPILNNCDDFTSKFSTSKWHLYKVVNTLARLNILFVSICDLKVLKIYLTKKLPFMVMLPIKRLTRVRSKKEAQESHFMLSGV